MLYAATVCLEKKWWNQKYSVCVFIKGLFFNSYFEVSTKSDQKKMHLHVPLNEKTYKSL